jgi:hypothetical protein
MFRLFTHRAAALALPLTLAICLPPMTVIAFNLRAQSASASSQPQSGKANSSTANARDAKSGGSSSAAAKEAARKKAFQADLKRLEDGGSVDHGANAGASQTLFVSPAVVNMVRGQRADLGAFDNHGRDISSQAEWALSNSYVATLFTGRGRPYIIAKSPGEVTIRARIGENESSADVTVYHGKALPAGMRPYIAAKIPGFHVQQSAPARPAAKRLPAPAQQAPAH